MAREFNRADRVAEALRRDLATPIAEFTRDYGGGLVTLTDVKVSSDLKHARLYVSVLGAEESVVLKLLHEQVREFRHHVANHMRLPTIPDLTFHIDDSLARGARVSALLDDSATDE